MIVVKFGGALLNGHEGIRRVLHEIRQLPRPLLVVVSAFADVTNMLEGLAHAAPADPADAARRLEAILEHHHAVARAVLGSDSYERWSAEVAPFAERLGNVVKGLSIVRELSSRTLDLIVHFGERFSSTIVTAALNESEGALGISALDIIITDDAYRYARPRFDLTRERVAARLLPPLRAGGLVVTDGYIARGVSGQATTMGRESSSYTATMLGEMIGSEEVRIYTNVPGILTADPAIVPDARTLPHLSYAMAHTLAELGAKVLHPRTVRPVERGAIPLVITKLDGASTVIDGRVGPDEDCYSIVTLPEASVISLETETANLDIERFAQTLSTRVPILWRHQSRRRVRLVTTRPVLPADLPLAELGESVETRITDVTIVSLARERGVSGDDMSRFFGVIGTASIAAVQGGIDARAVSAALPEGMEAVLKLHAAFAE